MAVEGTGQRDTLGDAFDAWTAGHPENEAIVSQAGRLTFAELRERVVRLAAALTQLGIAQGMHVALWMPNCVEWVCAFFALTRIGAVVVPINTRYKPAEVRTILAHGDVAAIMLASRTAKADLSSILRAAVPELEHAEAGREIRIAALAHLRWIIGTGGSGGLPAIDFDALMNRPCPGSEADALAARQARVSPGSPALMIYTSGTTGTPKGVVQTHQAIVKKAWDRGAFYGFGQADRLLLSVPLYTQWGCNSLLVGHLAHGVRVVLQNEFSAAEALQLIARERCSIFSGSPTHFRMLLDELHAREYDVSSLTYANVAGDLVPDQFYRSVLQSFPSARVISGYGLTETTGLVTATSPMDSAAPTFQTIGRPLPGVEIKAVDSESGRRVADGVEGEICTRGYHVMRGYYKAPEATRSVLDAEGWLHTGDIGCRASDGSWTFCGRKKDLIRTGGFNVFAADVEEYIGRHPAVMAAAVMGLPDARLGEVVGAVVWVDASRCPTEVELIDHCKEGLANFKVPRRIVVTTRPFPVSATGKVRKQQLKLLFDSLASPPARASP